MAVDETAKALQDSGVESPLLEAQLLVAHALGMDRLQILTRSGEAISSEKWDQVQALLARRRAREPLAYIRGTQEFYGLEFEVGPGVLIPRPETELLVDTIVETLRDTAEATVIDYGTGSGCIAVAAAVCMPNLHVIAQDRSPEALEIAKRNAVRHEVADRIGFLRADLGKPPSPGGSAEMIVSNPPYIPTEQIQELQPEVRDYEPEMALDGGADGLDFYRRLTTQAPGWLRPPGVLAVEVGAGQATSVEAMMKAAGFKQVTIRKDLQGIERVVVGHR